MSICCATEHVIYHFERPGSVMHEEHNAMVLLNEKPIIIFRDENATYDEAIRWCLFVCISRVKERRRRKCWRWDQYRSFDSFILVLPGEIEIKKSVSGGVISYIMSPTVPGAS